MNRRDFIGDALAAMVIVRSGPIRNGMSLDEPQKARTFIAMTPDGTTQLLQCRLVHNRKAVPLLPHRLAQVPGARA